MEIYAITVIAARSPGHSAASFKSAAKRSTKGADGRCRTILAISVLQAAAAATSVSESAGQQQDYDDEQEDREHGHLLSLS